MKQHHCGSSSSRSSSCWVGRCLWWLSEQSKVFYSYDVEGPGLPRPADVVTCQRLLWTTKYLWDLIFDLHVCCILSVVSSEKMCNPLGTTKPHRCSSCSVMHLYIEAYSALSTNVKLRLARCSSSVISLPFMVSVVFTFLSAGPEVVFAELPLPQT